MFLNETIHADFLIKRLNKKIEVYCLIKTLLKTPHARPTRRHR